MTNFNAMTIMLDNGRVVPVVKVPPRSNLIGLAQALTIPYTGGTAALVGGAGAFDGPEYTAVRSKVEVLLTELARIAISYNLAVVDGGTSFGVMRLMGQICKNFNYRFPLVGVAPSGMVIWHGNSQGINYQQTWFGGRITPEMIQRYRNNQLNEPVPLDDYHTSFVLVDANEWGDEVEMLASVAHELSGQNHSLEILVNGGAVARRDVTAYLQHGGQVIVIQGTGRFADELAGAVRAGYSLDPLLQAVINTNRVHLFSVDDSPQLFVQLLLRLGRWGS